MIHYVYIMRHNLTDIVYHIQHKLSHRTSEGVVGRDGEVIERHAGIPSRKKVVAQAAAGHAVEG